LDTIEKPFTKPKPEFDHGYASLKFINLTNTKVPSNTFDDLWDWRLNQGDLMGIHSTKKKLIDFDRKTDKPIFAITLPALGPVKEADAKDEEPENKDDSKTDHEAEESDLEMRQINMLSRLADMDPAAIARKTASKQLKGLDQKSETVVVSPKKTNLMDAKKELVTTFDKSRDSFSLSEEEPGSPQLKNSGKLKKSGEPNNRRPELLNLKYDEDFQYIGNVKIQDEVGKHSSMFESQKPVVKELVKPKRDSILRKIAKVAEKKYKEDGSELKQEKDNGKPLVETDKEKQKDKTDEGNKSKLDKKKKKKKKKQKEKRGDAIDLTKAYYEQEENIANYYRNKLQYNYLKIESHFPYNKIPNTAFNSIQDVVPHYSTSKKELSKEEQIIKQSSQKFPFQYNFTTLNNAKKSKKKKATGKPKKPVANLDQSKSNLTSGSSAGMSTDGNSSDSEIDNFEEEYQFSTQDESRGSAAKLERHKYFKLMERFIRLKPFPLNYSRNKSKILKAMVPGASDWKADSKFTNQVEPSSPLKSSKTARLPIGASKPSSSDYNADELVVIDQFLRDQIEVDKQYRDFKTEEGEHHDFKMLYVCIRANDAEHKLIEKFNWSGNQIFGPHQFTLSQTEKTLNSLNRQKLDIWKKGFEGLIYTTKRYAREFIDSSPVNLFLMISVFLNTIILAMDGLTPDSWADFFNNVNLAFTIIFIVEMTIKMYGLGIKLYCKDFFNIFDAFVVSISIVELIINSMSSGGNNATSGFKAVRIFRIFRVLRVTRLLRSLKFMKVIIEVLKGTAEQFMYIALLMFLFVFIFTLLGTQLFGGSFKFDVYDYAPVRYNFDSFSSAFFTVFTVLTLENWNSVLLNCLRSEANSAISVLYLVAWIFIGNYIFINLFLSILLEGFENSQAMQDFEELENEARELARVHKRLVHEAEKKKVKEESEYKEAYKKVLLITQPQMFINEEVIKKNQACYLVVRDEEEDGESLSDDCDLKKYLQKGLSSHKPKINPYSGVTCYKSLYYFKKTHWLRLFCGKVVSHPK
jgi:hypothetical protein